MGETTTTASDVESRGDIYQRVTDRIIEAIETGAGKWQMPWHCGVGGTAPVLPVNAVSKKPYRGINTVVLRAMAQAEAYPGAVWATYRQWTELGAQVRKGEKASPVVFWKISDREQQDDAEDQEEGRRARVFARGYSVFSAAQVDGFEVPALPERPQAEKIAHAEAFFAASGIETRHGGNRAFYRPVEDRRRRTGPGREGEQAAAGPASHRKLSPHRPACNPPRGAPPAAESDPSLWSRHGRSQGA